MRRYDQQIINKTKIYEISHAMSNQLVDNSKHSPEHISASEFWREHTLCALLSLYLLKMYCRKFHKCTAEHLCACRNDEKALFLMLL